MIKKFTLYLGLNDKDTKRQEVSTIEAYKIITNILGGCLITLLAIIVTEIPWPFTLNLSNIIIGCIMPLIPGVAFVNAIRDVASNDFISGIVKLVDALLVFVYIAVGVGCALLAYNEIVGGVILSWL